MPLGIRIVGGLLVLLTGLSSAPPAAAQGLIQRMTDRAKQQAVGRANRAAEEVADTAASKVERAVRCLISDAQCVKAAQESGQPVLIMDSNGTPVSSADSAAAIAAAVPSDSGAGTFDNAPATGQVESGRQEGAAPIPAAPPAMAAVDFSRDPPGAPSPQVTALSGDPVVAEVEGRRWLSRQERGGAEFAIELPQTLPPNYVVEFDALGMGGFVGFHPSGEPRGANAMVETTGVAGINDGQHLATQALPKRAPNVPHHVTVVGIGDRMAVDIDGTRLVERASPALAARGKRLLFTLMAYGRATMISAISVRALD
jgi:hypothetical protein